MDCACGATGLLRCARKDGVGVGGIFHCPMNIEQRASGPSVPCNPFRRPPPPPSGRTDPGPARHARHSGTTSARALRRLPGRPPPPGGARGAAGRRPATASGPSPHPRRRILGATGVLRGKRLKTLAVPARCSIRNGPGRGCIPQPRPRRGVRPGPQGRPLRRQQRPHLRQRLGQRRLSGRRARRPVPRGDRDRQCRVQVRCVGTVGRRRVRRCARRARRRPVRAAVRRRLRGRRGRHRAGRQGGIGGRRRGVRRRREHRIGRDPGLPRAPPASPGLPRGPRVDPTRGGVFRLPTLVPVPRPSSPSGAEPRPSP